MRRNWIGAALGGLVLAANLGSAAVPAGAQEAAGVGRWQWLADTYWYVPAKYLPALASNPALTAPIPVSDQTVYHIEQYRGGYFWGITAVSYNRASATASGTPTCLQLVGSVTPEGRVYLTFTPLGGSGGSAAEPTVGLGTMAPQEGRWTMENQMSSLAAANLLLTHWAYMHQCKRGDSCFYALPGIQTSLPEFLAPCVSAASGEQR